MLWFVLFGVGMGLYFVGMPKNTDDYWYMHNLRDWFAGQGVLYPENGGNIFKYGIPFNAIMETWKEHWVNDNTRLGNLIAPVLLLGPKWLWSGVLTVVWFLAIYQFGRFAGVDMRRSPLVVVLLTAFVFYMPWNDPFGCLVFQMNYIPSTFLGILLAMAFFQRKSNSDFYTLTMLFLLGVVTGWWHEGLGAPIGLGLLVVMTIYRRFRTRRSSAIVLGLLAGGMVIFLSPAYQKWSGAITVRSMGRDPFSIIYVWSPCFITFFLGVLAGIRAGFKRVWCDPKVVFGMITTLGSLIIMEFTYSTYRTGWWYYVMACVYTVYFLRVSFPAFWSRYTFLNSMMVAPLLIASMVYLGSVGYVALQMREDIERGFHEGIEHPERSRFCRYASISDLPWTCFQLPMSFDNFYDFPLTWKKIGVPDVESFSYVGNDCSRGGIPERLRYVTSGSGDEIDGNRGVRNVDGSLFMKATAADIKPFEEYGVLYCVYQTRVGFGNGYGIAEMHGIVFRSEKDGNQYIYLQPCFNWYVSHFKKLQYVDILQMMNTIVR